MKRMLLMLNVILNFWKLKFAVQIELDNKEIDLLEEKNCSLRDDEYGNVNTSNWLIFNLPI